MDDPINVTCAIDEAGQITLHRLTWRGQVHTIIAIGRQWDEEDGRHVLAEAGDGTRFEALLRREDFTWRAKQVWRPELWA